MLKRLISLFPVLWIASSSVIAVHADENDPDFVSFSGVVILQRAIDDYFFMRSDAGENWRIMIPKRREHPLLPGDLVSVAGWLEPKRNRYTTRLFRTSVSVNGNDVARLPAPVGMSIRDFMRHPADSPLPKPDWYASRVAVIGKVTDVFRGDRGVTILLEDGGEHAQVQLEVPITVPYPKDFAVGARVRVVGAALYSPVRAGKGDATILGYEHITVIAVGMDSVTVLTHPPFWTAGKFAVIIAILLVLLGIVMLWAASLRKMVKRAMATLETSIREKTRAKIEAEVIWRERLKLANDLHDGFQQLLASTAFRLQAATNLMRKPGNEEKISEQLALAVQSVAHTQTGLRAVLWSMTEESEGPSGLVGLFRYAASRMAHWEGVVRFQVIGSERSVSRKFAGSLLMILQEAVGNAIRHGGADNVTVTLNFMEDKLMMTVSDDGSGFETEEVRGAAHLGLRSMRDRAEQMNGTFEIKSVIGAGTTVKVEVPY